jgi:hypothetical protein
VALESAAFGLIDQRGRLVAQWTANARELGSLPVTSAGLALGRYRLSCGDRYDRQIAVSRLRCRQAVRHAEADVQHDGAGVSTSTVSCRS